MLIMGILHYYRCKWKTKVMQANRTRGFFMSNCTFELEMQTFFFPIMGMKALLE